MGSYVGLQGNPKKELPWSLWVLSSHFASFGLLGLVTSSSVINSYHYVGRSGLEPQVYEVEATVVVAVVVVVVVVVFVGWLSSRVGNPSTFLWEVWYCTASMT